MVFTQKRFFTIPSNYNYFKQNKTRSETQRILRTETKTKEQNFQQKEQIFIIEDQHTLYKNNKRKFIKFFNKANVEKEKTYFETLDKEESDRAIRVEARKQKLAKLQNELERLDKLLAEKKEKEYAQLLSSTSAITSEKTSDNTALSNSRLCIIARRTSSKALKQFQYL